MTLDYVPVSSCPRRLMLNAHNLRLIVPLPQFDHLVLQRISLKCLQFLALK